MGKRRRENERLEQKLKMKKLIYLVLAIVIITALVIISIIINTRDDIHDQNFNLNTATKGETEFEEKVLNADKPVLVDYYADWCQPCVMMAPIIEELELEQADFYVYKVNIDIETELANKAGAMSIPYFVLYNNGEFINSTVGVQTKENLIQFVKTNI